MRILHLLPASGGGTERFVRDIAHCFAKPAVAENRSEHYLLHVGPQQAALEAPGLNKFALLNLPDDVSTWRRFVQGLLASYAIDAVHSHLLTETSLFFLEQLSDYYVSLHDVSFLNPLAFSATDSVPRPDPAWLRRCGAALTRARKISAPSAYLQQLFHQHYPALHAELVLPGIATSDRAETAVSVEPSLEKPCIGIVGAIGPHKGSTLLEQIWANAGARAYRWVLIGYTGERNFPQADPELDLCVHGPFVADETTALLQQYKVDLVYFPNQLAESFCYALSDVWSAGIPALVPQSGALGERCAQVDGGWVLPMFDDAAAVLLSLSAIFSGDYKARLAEKRRNIALQFDIAVPSLEHMTRQLASFYESDRGPADAMPWSSDEVQQFLRSQLDQFAFRSENIRLARDYAQARADAESLTNSLRELDEVKSQSDAWAATLAQQVEAFRKQLSKVDLDNQSLQGSIAHQQEQITSLQAQLATIQAESAAELAALKDTITVNEEQINAQLHIISEQKALIEALTPRAHRYDRIAAWIPSPIKRLLRAIRNTLRH